MRSARSLARLAFSMAGAALLVTSASAQRPEYPESRTVEVSNRIHDTEIHDPYRWLEDPGDTEVQEWTRRQNALTRNLLDRFAEQRAALAARLKAVFSANVASSPRVHDGRYFYTRREGLQNHPVLYVRAGGLDAEPRVVINPNNLSEDGSVSMDWWYPSPDGKLIVYGRSTGGSELSTLYLRDVDSATDLALVIPNTRAAAVAWDVDAHGLIYTRYPAPGSVPAGDENYFRRVFYHKFGTDWEDDATLWGEGRPKEEWPNVANSADNRHQFLAVSADWSRRNDLYMRAMGEAAFRPVAVGLDGRFTAEVLEQRLYLLTDYEAPRYRVLATDVEHPAQENWREIIPQQQGVIDGFVAADGKLVVSVMENAFSRLFIYEPDGQLLKEVDLPTLGSVDQISGRPGSSDLFFRFESFAYPPVVFHYDLREHTMRPFDRMQVDVALDKFETQQVWFNSRDGTRVPMFVTHKKGLTLDGKNPTVLAGYGGFGISLTPRFRRGSIPWLDAGGVLAVASIRGGGEFGSDWHLAGRLVKKQNCFDDFIAAAEKLIADRYTSPTRLGILGGSNGGLLVGAVLVQRPELFRAAYCAVPLLDMIRYHNFSVARLWIPEYGSAENPEQFAALHAYSPYHNVSDGVEYPAVLFQTADNDSRVDPMHARKMAARMQAASASDRPVLLWVEGGAGHGAGAPLSKEIAQQVDMWTFLMWQLGVFEPPPASQPAPGESR